MELKRCQRRWVRFLSSEDLVKANSPTHKFLSAIIFYPETFHLPRWGFINTEISSFIDDNCPFISQFNTSLKPTVCQVSCKRQCFFHATLSDSYSVVLLSSFPKPSSSLFASLQIDLWHFALYYSNLRTCLILLFRTKAMEDWQCSTNFLYVPWHLKKSWSRIYSQCCGMND